MKKLLALSLLLMLCMTPQLRAQDTTAAYSPNMLYKNALGVRLGVAPGITFKHFFNDQNAVEILLHTGLRYRGFLLTGLFERHQQLLDVEGLKWYYGGGVHIGIYNHNRWSWIDQRTGRYRTYDYPGGGIDGIIGIEYLIQQAPFVIGLDLKPMLEFFPRFDYEYGSALSVRYTFQ